MIPHIVETYLALLLVACVVAIVARKVRIPYTIALVLVGLLIAFLKLAPGVVISKDLIFTLILPPLLFYGAMEVDLTELRNNWVSVVAFAIPGVVVSTIVIGWFIHWGWGVGLLTGLLFGALITPTDPVSVLAICKEVHAPKRLRVILEGESLFNDGTGVVIFGMILAMIIGEESFNLGALGWEFAKVTLGGTLVGGLLGYGAYRFLSITNDHLIEVTLTLLLAFGASLIAEWLHVSGVIAAVVAGIIIGNYGRIFSMSAKSREVLESFWGPLNFIINSVLFLLIGLELQAISYERIAQMWAPILWAVLVVQCARAVTTYPIIWIQRRVRPKPVPQHWDHVIFWGGLKGSIPLALVVGLPQSFADRDLFLAAAFIVVLVSLLVQGLSIKTLLVRLGVGQSSESS